VAAISVDSPEESSKLRASQGYTFTFLSDPKAEAIRRAVRSFFDIED